MNEEKGVITIETDEEPDPAEPEKALVPAEFDPYQDPEPMRLAWEVIEDLDEDASVNSLTPPQIEAAALVAMGVNDVEIGERVGVSRQTVNIWKNHNGDFISEVRLNRAEVWESYRIQFRTLIPRAIEVLSTALNDYDKKTRIQAALFIMRAVKLEPIALEKGKRGSIRGD